MAWAYLQSSRLPTASRQLVCRVARHATNTGGLEDISDVAISGGGALGSTRGLTDISLEVRNPIDSPCECEHTDPDSLDARLFSSVVLAVAPAVTMDEAYCLFNATS